jgi:hypothetical protein
MGEASTPRIDSVISEIKKRAGAPTARTCPSIISGVMGLAVRYGAITVNPVREVDRIEHNAKKLPRALTAEEVRLLRKQLGTDERAVRADLPDLVTFMLGTGEPRLDAIADLLGVDESEARAALKGLVYDDPTEQRLVPAAEYVSGNVRIKHAAAIAAAETDDKYIENVAALRAVIPADISPADITPQLGAAWISPDDVQSFLREILSDRHLEVRRIVGVAVEDHWRRLQHQRHLDVGHHPVLRREARRATVAPGTDPGHRPDRRLQPG